MISIKPFNITNPMKNKLFLLSLGLVALLTGCNNENDAGSSPGNSSMESFRLELPVATTRAVGDTYTPTRYIMEVYPDKAATGIPLMHMEQDNGTFNVSLTYGTTYTCLFWADNGTPDNVVNDEYEAADLKAVKIKTDFCPANPAYGGMAQVTAGVSSADAYTVQLNHAVAKVNYIQTKPLTATGNTLTVVFPTTFQLNVGDWSTSEIASTTTTHVFTNIDKVETETTIATSYIIAPSATASTQNLSITLNSETAKVISNVPLQRNYKTNMRGAFSDLYNADMTCTLTPDWDLPEEDKDLISIWDGTTATQPGDYTDTPGEVKITSAAELAWLVQQSNATNQKTFSGYTFILTTDIDLKSHLWPQIGHNSNGFQGTLDGGGQTVHGLYVTNGNAEENAGFIYRLKNGTVRNITVRGQVNSSTSDEHPYYSFGGITGYANGATLENCNNACTIVATGNVGYTGGIAGYAENSIIDNCVNYGTIAATGSNSSLAGIVGRLEGTSTLRGNENKGTVTYESGQRGGYLGGIIGVMMGTLTLNDNVNSGKVLCTLGEHIAPNCMGGIVGQLLALSGNNNTTVSGNKNEGEVSSVYNEYLGGIIGNALAQTGHTVTLTGNITTGTPVNTIIALCQLGGGTITVDGNDVTHSKPYPYTE